MPRKQRIDLLLVEKGLATSRTQAQALVMAGAVVAGEQRIDKPGQLVSPELPLRVKEDAAPITKGKKGKAEKPLKSIAAKLAAAPPPSTNGHAAKNGRAVAKGRVAKKRRKAAVR